MLSHRRIQRLAVDASVVYGTATASVERSWQRRLSTRGSLMIHSVHVQPWIRAARRYLTRRPPRAADSEEAVYGALRAVYTAFARRSGLLADSNNDVDE